MNRNYNWLRNSLTEQIGTAERSATIDYIQKNIKRCKLVIKDSDKSQKEAIRDWANSMKRLTELGERQGQLSLIASEIRHTCKDEFGWTDNQCDLIRHVLDSEFKDHRFDKLTKQGGSRSSLENLNPEVLDPFTQEENLAKVEDLDEVYQKVRYLKDRIEKYADDNGKALVHHEERQDKISINNIKFESEIDESTQTNFNKFIKSLSLFNDNFVKIKKKMEKYPLTDANVRRELNYYILDFKTRIDAINNVLQRLADDKGTLSLGRWPFMKGFQQYDTLGEIASMLKQITLSGKPNKPSTKWVKKVDTKEWDEYQKAVDFHDFAESIRTLIYHLSNWYDNSSSYPTVRATHKEQLHDKRSESA